VKGENRSGRGGVGGDGGRERRGEKRRIPQTFAWIDAMPMTR